jgi:hypothetical protein
MNYADRLASKIETYDNPSVLGLDPRIEQMPKVARKLADERAADKTGSAGPLESFMSW